MSELEIRANAMLNEVAGQRNAALDKCAVLAADKAALLARLAELEKKPEAHP